MTAPHRRSRKRWKLLWIAGALLLFAFVMIDDWRRDFTTYHAELRFDSPDPRLRSFVSERPTAELVVGLKWAARRIGSWEYVGTASEGKDTFVIFVRTDRILRLKDDVRMRVRDRGDDRVVAGESRARLGIGDLGRNPRNLHRILLELQDVLDGAE